MGTGVSKVGSSASAGVAAGVAKAQAAGTNVLAEIYERAEVRRNSIHVLNFTSRFIELASLVIVICLIATSNTNECILRFQDYQAFSYVLIASSIALLWVLLMFILDSTALFTGNSAWPLLWCLFVAVWDWIFSFLLASVGAAGLGMVMTNEDLDAKLQRLGQSYVPTPCVQYPACSTFCNKTKIASAFAVVSAFAFTPSLAISSARAVISYYEK